VEVELRSFLTLALDGVDGSTSILGRFSCGKETRYPWGGGEAGWSLAGTYVVECATTKSFYQNRDATMNTNATKTRISADVARAYA
jgi:hypothetical protein